MTNGTVSPSNMVDITTTDNAAAANAARRLRRKKLYFWLGIVVVVAIVVLLTTGFKYVDFYQYAFLKTSASGTVDRSKVYTAGRYFVGPGKEFKIFNADVHFEVLQDIAVFTRDKLEVKLTCEFQYRLRPEDLVDLHDSYDLFYRSVVKSTGAAAVKGQASHISIDDYLRNREEVERKLHQAMALRLHGICCRKDCVSTQSCVPGCKAYDTCSKADKGVFVTVDMFQLHTVAVPADVKNRYLTQALEEINEIKEKYIQEEKIVKKETEKLVKDINNQVQIISKNATAQSNLMKAQAQAKASLKIEEARNSGLTIIYSRLNITTEQHKASFNYLRELRKNTDAKINVNYDTLMARD